MTVAAHPPGLSGRIAHHKGVVRNVPGYHRTGRHKRVPPDRDTANNCRVGADGTTALQSGLFVQRVPVDLGAWVADVGQHTGWPQEHLVLNDGPRVDGDIVLDFDAVSNHRSAIHVDVLADDAAVPRPPAARSRPLL